MIFLYYTKQEVKSQSLIEKILVNGKGYPLSLLKRNENGKPYLEGNPVFFNATNTRGFSALALAKSEIGLDAESLERKPVEELKAFTAKEAYVKRKGESLFSRYKKLSFLDGVLFYDGERVDEPRFYEIENTLIALSCSDGELQTINLDEGDFLL